MLIETLSVFPEMFEPVMSTSILGRARKAGLFDFKAYNLRDWTHDRHRTVDDEPYGGGQGMLMKVEPIAEAIEAISSEGPKPTVVFFTPCGEPFTQHVAERLLKSERLLFVCSRYEGVDERAYAYADERLSIGDYVLTGGELPAMVVADAVVRLIPGALGDEMSNVDESFSTAEDGGLLEYAQYTRPAEFNGEGVPPVLVWQARQSAASVRYLPRTRRLAFRSSGGTPTGLGPAKSASMTGLPPAKLMALGGNM